MELGVLIRDFTSNELRFYLGKPHLWISGPKWREFKSDTVAMISATAGGEALACVGCGVPEVSPSVVDIL